MKSKASTGDGTKLIAANRYAYHEYFILDKIETGIALVGSELRPCREGRVNLKDGYAEAVNGQLWLNEVHIGSNAFSNRLDHAPLRKRRLLAHKREILKLQQKLQVSGHTLIPLRMYFKNGKVKVELGLAKGKAQYDKRATIAKKDLKRELDREMSERR